MNNKTIDDLISEVDNLLNGLKTLQEQTHSKASTYNDIPALIDNALDIRFALKQEIKK